MNDKEEQSREASDGQNEEEGVRTGARWTRGTLRTVVAQRARQTWNLRKAGGGGEGEGGIGRAAADSWEKANK